jgi:HpcH/HpaI aldolase/citrate lyase family
MATHSLLRAFKSNQPAFGAWLMLPGTFNARTVAQFSPNLSWVMIDCEHGLTSLQPNAAESIQAIQGAGAGAPSPIVRIPATGFSTGTSWQIKYALDAGARGVLVPMVCPLLIVGRGMRNLSLPCNPGLHSCKSEGNCGGQSISSSGQTRTRQSVCACQLGY